MSGETLLSRPDVFRRNGGQTPHRTSQHG